MGITKTIIPAAGLGTRFLPFTKAVPKELLPILTTPAIQYNVQEAVDAKASTIIFVVNKEKDALANHFDPNLTLETFLKKQKKNGALDDLSRLIRQATFYFVRQPEPLGLGHAIWTARDIIHKEYFGVMLPDEVIFSKTPALAQLAQVASQEKCTVIAVQEVPLEFAPLYGMIEIKKKISPNLFQVANLVEKPSIKDAPSNLAVIGRYIISPRIFPILDELEPDANGETQLTDGLTQLARQNEKIFAVKLQGVRHDVGNVAGWLQANIACALQDPTLAPIVTKMLGEIKS